MLIAWGMSPTVQMVPGVTWLFFFFFNDTATPEFSPLPLHAALPILRRGPPPPPGRFLPAPPPHRRRPRHDDQRDPHRGRGERDGRHRPGGGGAPRPALQPDPGSEIGRAHV